MKAHITNLGLENFRVFKNKTDFEFAPITILTGTNSSGKSSLISALELLQGLEINKEINEKGGLSEHEFPTILEDISSLQLFKFAQTKGDFQNLLSKGVNSNCLNFSFQGDIKGIDPPCKLLLTYSGKPNQIGYQNGELTRMLIEGMEEKNSVYHSIPIFKLELLAESIEITINWKYFYEHYKLNAEKFIKKPKMNPAKVSGNAKSLAKFLDAAKNDALANKALFYDKDTDAIVMFDPKKDFLSIPIPQGRDSKNWFDNLCAFDESNNSILAGKLDDDVDLPIFLEQVNKILSPLMQEALLSRDELKLVITKYDFWDFRNLNSVLKHIYFGGGVKKEPSECNDILDSFIYGHSLPLDFSANHNGKAAKLFFESFILSGVKGCLEFALPKFKGVNFLKTNRNISKRKIDILELRQLPNPTDYYVNLLVQSNEKIQEDVMTSLNKYFSKTFLGIADEVVIRAKDESQDSAVIMLRKGDYWFNLADEGFGINMIFPVVLLAVMTNDKLGININRNFEPNDPNDDGWGQLGFSTVLVIEEPESNLHPALQSKLADVFVDVAKKFNTQFIIETHSEYLIRKLQYLTAKGQIKPEDTAIYYFYPPDDVPPGEDQVKRIDIQEDGSMTDDFGTGFFDEADKIAMSIWNMNKSQKN
jgi:predicted ATPase